MEDADYSTTFALEGHNWWFVGTRRICLDMLDRELARRPAGGSRPTIVDLGCGTGITLSALRQRGTVVGLDYSPLALEFCQQRGEDLLLRGDATALPLPDGGVDAVSAIGVLEHLDDDSGALADWVRVLRPGGALMMLTSSYQWMWSGHDVSNHHTRRYTKRRLQRLMLDAGFVDPQITYVNSILFPGIAVVRAVERLVTRGRTPAPRKDTGAVPGPLNRALLGLLEIERRIIAKAPLPFGVSMVATARAPE